MSGSTLTAAIPSASGLASNQGTAERRMRVLSTGTDDRVWALLEQIPFIVPERAAVAADGTCTLRGPDQKIQCDAVIVDQPAGAANPISVIKSIKAQASQLPIVVLTAPEAADLETAALDAGAEPIVKTGPYRRRLAATLKQLHQRFEMVGQYQALAGREARLRQIVETMPQGVGVLGRNFAIQAVNALALELLGASRAAEVVGRDFTTFVEAARREDVSAMLLRMAEGEQTTIECDLVDDRRGRRAVELIGVALGQAAAGAGGVLIVFREPAEVARTSAELDAVSAQLADAERRCRELEAEVESTRASSASTNRALEAKLVDALARLDTVEADRARQKETDAASTEMLERERRTLEEARAAWTARERDLVAELEAARAETARATEKHRNEHEAWDRERSGLEDRVATAERARADVERSKTELGAEGDEARRQLAAERDRLAAERDRLAAERDRLAGELEQARARSSRPSGGARLLDELRQARRLEEVGTLAASMAADIADQLRQVVDIGAEIRAGMAADDARRRSVDLLVKSADDAVSLVRQLIAFSQRQAQPLETIDLNDAIRRAEPTLRQLVGSHVEFNVELGPAASILQTEGDLNQLLTALIVNARDVLPMGGRVALRTDLVGADGSPARGEHADDAGVQAVVDVNAYGYRTQRALAAPAAEMLARRCGGSLSVTNDTDRSTSFRVHFPGCRRQAAGA